MSKKGPRRQKQTATSKDQIQRTREGLTTVPPEGSNAARRRHSRDIISSVRQVGNTRDLMREAHRAHPEEE